MLRLIACVLIAASTFEASAFQPAVYRGTWRSTTTGHRGPMRVKIPPRGNGTYDARFTGRFALVIPFSMRTTMTAVSSHKNQTTLVATKRLPLFGDYRMTARVTPCRINACYSSNKDRGLFSMSRRR